MDIDAKISLLEAVEGLEPYTHIGYGGAGLAWAEIPGLSHLAAWAMVGSAVLSVVCKFAARYKARLLARTMKHEP